MESIPQLMHRIQCARRPNSDLMFNSYRKRGRAYQDSHDGWTKLSGVMCARRQYLFSSRILYASQCQVCICYQQFILSRDRGIRGARMFEGAKATLEMRTQTCQDLPCSLSHSSFAKWRHSLLQTRSKLDRFILDGSSRSQEDSFLHSVGSHQIRNFHMVPEGMIWQRKN